MVRKSKVEEVRKEVPTQPKYAHGREVSPLRGKSLTPDEVSKLNTEINERAREFNKAIADPFDRLARSAPHRLLRPDGIAELRRSAADHVNLVSETQSERARSPRPRKRSTQRSETVAAMRRARSGGQTLRQFLAAAEADSIDGVTITEQSVGARYIVACDTATDGEWPVAYNTLKDWWAAARTNPRAG
jgi:hypothetical protein